MPAYVLSSVYWRETIGTHQFILLIPPKRIEFLRDEGGVLVNAGRPSFDCFYFCVGLSKSGVVFLWKKFHRLAKNYPRVGKKLSTGWQKIIHGLAEMYPRVVKKLFMSSKIFFFQKHNPRVGKNVSTGWQKIIHGLSKNYPRVGNKFILCVYAMNSHKLSMHLT